jgi:hypothetical protein
LSKIINRVNKLLQTLILKLQIKADGICFNIFDENYKEVMAVRYGNEEIFVEIDLPFKEIITIKAFGLEVQSKESLVGLERLAKKILENVKDIKELHNTE